MTQAAFSLAADRRQDVHRRGPGDQRRTDAVDATGTTVTVGLPGATPTPTPSPTPTPAPADAGADRPNGFTATIGSTGVTLRWPASTDEVGVRGYRIHRNGALLGTATATAVLHSGVFSGSCAVAACDATGRVSAASAAVTAR